MSRLKPFNTLTLEQVATLINGEVESKWAARPFGRVSTDSRAIQTGEFFLALRGERFDGHKFCLTASQHGAAGLIVEPDFSVENNQLDLPILKVKDTLRAYGDLAAVRRYDWGGPVMAISGSAGKTTTRSLVAASLKKHLATLEPIRNYNNLIGVPYTLLQLLPEHQVTVLELGMNMPGELRRLAEIADPSAALITQIGMTHVGMFNSMSELVNAKLDLFRGCAPGTPLVINASCPHTAGGIAPFLENHPLIPFLGEKPQVLDHAPAVRVENVTLLEPVGYRFDLALPEQRLTGLELRLFGRHHLDNVAAAAALLLAANYPPEWVAEALPDFRTQPLRGDLVQTDEMTLILDCYNASPPAMLGALKSLHEVQSLGRRILVLADMLELGEQSRPAHESLLPSLRALAPSLFFGLGPECSRLAEILKGEGWAAEGFNQRSELTESLKWAVQPGDLIFFKGSHGFGLENVAHAVAPEAGILPL